MRSAPPPTRQHQSPGSCPVPRPVIPMARRLPVNHIHPLDRLAELVTPGHHPPARGTDLLQNGFVTFPLPVSSLTASSTAEFGVPTTPKNLSALLTNLSHAKPPGKSGSREIQARATRRACWNFENGTPLPRRLTILPRRQKATQLHLPPPRSSTRKLSSPKLYARRR